MGGGSTLIVSYSVGCCTLADQPKSDRWSIFGGSHNTHKLGINLHFGRKSHRDSRLKITYSIACKNFTKAFQYLKAGRSPEGIKPEATAEGEGIFAACRRFSVCRPVHQRREQ